MVYDAGQFFKYKYSSIHYNIVWFVLDFRKKVLDFYQRNSMSAYCLAFAYRPVSEVGK